MSLLSVSGIALVVKCKIKIHDIETGQNYICSSLILFDDVTFSDETILLHNL
jgi:hypothetical protein